jgi:hypothetical protein
MIVAPLAAAERLADFRRTEAAKRAADHTAVVPRLAALLTGEAFTREERGAIVNVVLRGWRDAGARAR